MVVLALWKLGVPFKACYFSINNKQTVAENIYQRFSPKTYCLHGGKWL